MTTTLTKQSHGGTTSCSHVCWQTHSNLMLKMSFFSFIVQILVTATICVTICYLWQLSENKVKQTLPCCMFLIKVHAKEQEVIIYIQLFC